MVRDVLIYKHKHNLKSLDHQAIKSGPKFEIWLEKVNFIIQSDFIETKNNLYYLRVFLTAEYKILYTVLKIKIFDFLTRGTRSA